METQTTGTQHTMAANSMKGHRYDFRALKDHTTTPPVPRARGGRTEMRAAGNPDVFKEADGDEGYAAGDLKMPARGKRRATRARNGKTLGTMSGATPKHRADRAPRRKKFAVGGTASSGPLAGMMSVLPVVPVTPGHTMPAAGAPPPDFGQQMINAGISMLGKNWPKDDDSKSEKPVDTGYAVYSNGSPIGIRGIAPFAGGPDDISAQKRGGRVKSKRGGR
jgi:hypothetical protein